jgi:predicted phosphodiesterase
MPPRSLSAETREAIRQRFIETGSITEAARVGGVTRNTARTYCTDLRDRVPTPPDVRKSRTPVPPPRLPDPAPEAGGPGIPAEEWKPLSPYRVDVPGWHFVLGDVHLPMHDRQTVELAVREAREKRAAVVLLNGDIMDMFGITPFFREPTRDRFVDEIDKGCQFIAWIRGQFPQSRIIYREGNHEFRLRRYLGSQAPELADLPCLKLDKLLDFAKHGVEWVADKRKVLLGNLITLHGHEFRKGEGINPARLAFLRATASVLVGHHHRTSEHHQRALDDRHHATWSVGCACFTSPDYDPYNQWNFGYAMVEVATDGWFSVHNRRVLNGRVV